MTNATTTEMDQTTSLYDMTNLEKMKDLGTHAPEAMKAFVAFDKAALAAGAIPVKYKELMAMAVAFTTQCPYCIELHTNKAREYGASRPGDRRIGACGSGLARRRGHHAWHPCDEVNVRGGGGPREPAVHTPGQRTQPK